jgi:DNA (cytosine-5)-methyltransferase 1
MNEPTHLDLFSGIGGFALASNEVGFKTVGFCEIDSYCQAILRKHWPRVPLFGDIRSVNGFEFKGISLLTGGFPCQPFSVAGKKKGKDDDRYLWPEMLRIIRQARPTWIVGENVAGIVNMALDQVHIDLESEGYEVESLIIPACGVDAPHRRNRVWIVAHSGRTRQSGDQRFGSSGTEGISCGHLTECGSYSGGSDVADSETVYAQGLQEGQGEREFGGGCRWLPEPGLGRVADGVSNRVHRLKGLGNAIVPQVAKEILQGVMSIILDESKNLSKNIIKS